MHPGDSQLQPLPVPPSEAVDAWAAHRSEALLQHGEPGLELTTPLPAPVRRRHRRYIILTPVEPYSPTAILFTILGLWPVIR